MIDFSQLGEFGEAINAAIDKAAERKISEILSRINEPSEKAKEIKVTLEIIMAKKFLSADETAFLFNCGSDKIYQLVKDARAGKSSHPIPFTPMGDTGMVRFERVKLLEWAMPKPKEQNK